jgi:D-alanyl-D-alanine carboxypeptidase (penicillin-binding protein 5/6)
MNYTRFLIIPILAFITPANATEVVPPPPTVTSKAHILIDYDSGVVLAEFNADEHLDPASLTKIMSMDVIFQEIANNRVKLTDEVLISEQAWRTGGSRTFAEVGKKFKVEDLLKGAIIQSGNDATVALAEHVAGSEQVFADMMNNQAKKLGLTGSHFVNATGLPDPNHYSTARDMAKVSAATIREFPEFYKIYSIKEYELNKIKQHNRNQLLWKDPSVDGVKTGHTEAAGYCLVSSAKRNEQRLISVIMGSKSPSVRASDSLALLNYGFRFYETHKLYDKRQVLGKVRIWRGAASEVEAGPAQAIYVTVPRQQYDKLELKMEMAPSLPAPVAAGQNVGRVLVRLGDKQLVEVPLIALTASPEGGMFRYLVDTMLLWLN